MADSELFRPPPPSINGDDSKGSNAMPTRGVNGTRNDYMTDDHRFALQKLKERDAQIVSSHQ